MKQNQMHRRTPQKILNSSQRNIEEILIKDLPSPFFDRIPTSLLTTFTPLKNQPEYLLSPSPIKKDLFSQLLGTETRNHSPLKYDAKSIMEQESSIDQSDSSQNSSLDLEDNESENEGNWEDENGIKKRKRKSTSQIKLLKQELNGEVNWTKDKIQKMAKVTGLSQSQVYKWCWDQKKKQIKTKESSSKNYLQKRKFIRKESTYKLYHKYDESDEQIEEHHLTKPKLTQKIDQNIETQRKIKKRLIFS